MSDDKSVVAHLNELTDTEMVLANFEVNAVHSTDCYNKLGEVAADASDVAELDAILSISETSILHRREDWGVNVRKRNGNYNLSKMFDSPKAYSTYRSAKTVLRKAKDLGVPIRVDDKIVPKSRLEKLCKETVIDPVDDMVTAMVADRLDMKTQAIKATETIKQNWAYLDEDTGIKIKRTIDDLDIEELF